MNKIGLSKRKNMKIGLLGGSFNPAHEGHIYISEQALRLFGLDEIWWLVTPQNPLKKMKTNDTLIKRLNFAKKLVKNSKIRIDSVENKYKNNFTANTLKNIINRYKGTKFIWLMGADNLDEFHKWYQWQTIYSIIPIAVFDREYYSYSVFNSIAGKRYFNKLHKTKNSQSIFKSKLPSWRFLRIHKNSLSSTKIRNNKNYLKI